MVSLLILGALPRVFSQTAGDPDKRGYNLFNPTPENLLRELSADRPDKTESPYTVDAGHFQIEMDLLNYSYDHDNSEDADRSVRVFGLTPINFKVGLLNHSDLQIIAETFNVQRTDDHNAHSKETISGFGDVLVRWKTNLWGNDGGKTAFGVMPFLKVPTNQQGLGNDAIEGGVIFPIAVELPHDWELGAQTEVDYVQNSIGSGAHQEFINTITAGHRLLGKLEAYLEFFSSISTEADSAWIGTVDFGLTYMLGENIRLDGGVNLGVTEPADDVNPFVGLTVRF